MIKLKLEKLLIDWNFISWLKIAWNLSLLYKKLPEQEKADFMEILDNKDDVGMEFFLKRHWEQIS